MFNRLLTAAFCLSLGACNMYTTPGTGPSAFDGSYAGTMTSLNAASYGCTNTAPAPGTLAVKNGAVAWNATPSLVLYAPVMQDGAFVAQNGPVFLSGKITNKAMVARVNTGSCHFIYDLTKST